jgi:hypothetical protein
MRAAFPSKRFSSIFDINGATDKKNTALYAKTPIAVRGTLRIGIVAKGLERTLPHDGPPQRLLTSG